MIVASPSSEESQDSALPTATSIALVIMKMTY